MSASDDGIFVLGNYNLIEVLGIGAMGYVYRARQVNLDRDVAVKILSPKLAQETGYLDLFFREARTAASLEHPHIVPVFDYGVQQNVSYVAMRLLLGGSLGEKLQFRVDRRLQLPSIPETTSVLMQAASALDYAHARGVIHRDIKPSNLMFDQHGVVYIVDFGIAKLIGTTSSMKGGTFLGTPSFMAPEQWEGLSPTPVVDQYALGAVIYMMLTGHPPFEADTALALMSKHLKETPKDVQAYRPELPDQVNVVLHRAMAKQPDKRYPNAMTFAQEFAAAVQGLGGERSTGFLTYSLPQTAFTLPFPTPTGTAVVTSRVSTETSADPPATLRLSAAQGRNLILWVESAMLAVAVILIVILLMQRTGNDPPSTPVAAAAGAISSATPVLTAEPTLSPSSEGNIELAQLQSSSTPMLTDTPTPAATTEIIAADTAAVTGTVVPPVSPTSVSVARPTVPWHNGSHLKIMNSSGAWLRSHPSTRAAQIATLAYNNLVTATGNYFFDGRQWWWEVRASWGAVGWVEQYSLVEQ